MPISESSGLTRYLACGADWRSSSRGLYVPSDLPPEKAVDQRIVGASMVCPSDGAITGWAALRWLTGAYFTGRYAGQDLPIPIAVQHRGFRERPGIAPSWERVLPREIVEVDGVRITVPAYSATFEARHAHDGMDAVQALDMAMMFDLTSIAELTDFAICRLFKMTGIAQLDAAIVLASENCWSPPETTMRLLWEVELGLRRPLCNWPVFDLDGRHIGTPDLIDPVAGVVGEYNGAHHLDTEQQVHDAAREVDFRRAGLEVVTMTSGDLPGSNSYLDRVEAAYHRMESRAGRPRGWTTALPTYWVPTHSVELRRALTDQQREQFLGWQRLPRHPDSHARSAG
jgi:hypothetical protein